MSRPRLTSAFLAMCAVGLGATALGAACTAGSSNTGTFTGGAAGSGANGSGGSGAGTGRGGDDVGFDSGTGNSGGSGGSDTACAAEPHQAMQAPLDMYIMLDQSGSMSGTVAGGQTKWDAVTKGLQTFLTQPGTSGISVGIQYFGTPPGGGGQCGTSCITDADCGPAACGPCFIGICLGGASAGDSCNSADYAKPDVEIAPLPGAAANLLISIGKHGPSTGTPTRPALEGALNHASQWSQTHPGHVSIAVLATDGIPQSCSPYDQTTLANVAAQGVTAGIKTFTIGVFEPADFPEGPNLMNAIAAAGGTGTAFIFDTTNPNVQNEFKKALDMIRGAALGCQYSIPTPTEGQPDYGKVNVQYTPGGGGAPVLFNHYADKASCPPSGDGWYYDDNLKPTQIFLCDSTCNTVGGDMTGKIDILLGCKTKDPT